MIYQNSTIAIYFGNANDQLYKDEYQAYDAVLSLLEQQRFVHLRQTMGIDNLLFMNQIHSNFGIPVTSEHNNTPSFKTNGDFLITREKGFGIGIMTADCLPILLHDTKTNSIGAVHAGWRGSVDQVALKAIKAMQENYDTAPSDLHVYFGPAAHVCCYEVSHDFTKNIPSYLFANQSIKQKNGKLFFDNSMYNRMQLEQVGITSEQIKTEYSCCTIENQSFFSHRRMPTLSGRQMSIIALKQLIN